MPTEIQQAIAWLKRQTQVTDYLAQSAITRYNIETLTPDELIDLVQP